MTTTERQQIELPPGYKFESHHRFCPRCGLNLVEEAPQAEANQQEANEIKSIADYCIDAGMSAQDSAMTSDFFERMVSPLTQAEEEQAKRNEQCWLAWQRWQSACGSEQKDGESTGHEDFIPMVKRQFFEWVSQFRRLFK